MGRIEKTVFISYRRKHVAWALAVSQNLIHRGYDVFFDYISIGAGDFGQVITENVKAMAHFLVLLAPSSLEDFDKKENWMRKEIELAIETKRNIIPVMLEGFDFGAPETKKYLTGSLETLHQYNGLNLPAEYFDAGMDRLCTQFLNIPLSEVLIPVSLKVQKEVEEQKEAIEAAEPVSDKTLTAWEWFERAYQAKEPEEQLRLYSKAIELDKNLAEAYNNRGNCYADMKQFERSITDYDESIRLDPKNAKVFFNRGSSYADLKQYERAIADYDEAIKLDPKYVDAYYNRGISYKNLKQYEKSIADYDEAIWLDSKYPYAYNNRGLVYSELKQFERAIADYDEAIRLYPNYTFAYNNRGNSYHNLKQYERAIADYDKAIQLDPEYAAVFYNRGNCYTDMKQYEQAITDYDEAIRLGLEDIAVYNNRGLCYANLKQHERAIADYDEAIRIDSYDSNAYFNKACAYSLLKKIPESIQWLRESLVRDKKYCELTMTDSDFDVIRNEPEFQQLMAEFCDC